MIQHETQGIKIKTENVLFLKVVKNFHQTDEALQHIQ